MNEERKEEFTPGPWTEKHIRTDTHGIAWKNIRGGDGDLLAEVCGETNAHLIAAAPDLYTACEAHCKDCPWSGGRGDCIKCLTFAALKKARGEAQ